MVFVMGMPSFAAYKQSISLPENQVWKTAGSVSRSGNYSTVGARCHSVYPESGTDNYTTIQCRALNSSGVAITSVTKLHETAADYTLISIKEGYLSATSVTFQFRGNTSNAASAIVSYRGY